MPWDRTQLWRGRFSEGNLTDLRCIAGQDGAESVLQPRWAPDGRLAYISDRTGWWNLYIDDEPLAPMEAEFAGPAWNFGDSDYAILPDGAPFCDMEERRDGVPRASSMAGLRPPFGPSLYLLCPSMPGELRTVKRASWP